MERNQKLKLGRTNTRRGSQLIEAMLMMLPFLALIFLTMDAAWGLFIKATLQHAVHEGVRYGVTGQVSGLPGEGQVASIRAIVLKQSLGLLNSQGGTLSVSFFDPVSFNATSNQGGNIVEVDVRNYQIAPLAPLLRSGVPIAVNVSAADRIEGSPGGIAPNP